MTVIVAAFVVYDFRERLPTATAACAHLPNLTVPARYRDASIFYASCPWQVSIDAPKVYFGQMLLGEHGAQFYPSPHTDRLPNDPTWWLDVKPLRLETDSQASRSADDFVSKAQHDSDNVWFTIKVQAWEARRKGDFSVSGARFFSALLVDHFVEIRDAN